MPLFVWKALCIIAASIGTYIWLNNPAYRLTDISYIHFKSMLISLSIQLLLLMFELLSCDKLESGRHLWVLAFIPLIFISLLSIAIVFWAIKNDRSFELELFCSVNIIQFIFIALRLDRFIIWSWLIVFVPLWIIMSLSIIGCLYALIFYLILLRSPEVGVCISFFKLFIFNFNFILSFVWWNRLSIEKPVYTMQFHIHLSLFHF